MNEELELQFEPIEGSFEDPLEQVTFARLRLSLGDRTLTRVTDRRGSRPYLKLPLHRLATGIATHWWSLLYEPWRSDEVSLRRLASHRLDAFLPGFAFPALALWSAGDEAMTAESGPVWRLSEEPVKPLSEREREIAVDLAGSQPVSPRSLSRTELLDEARERVSVSRRSVEDQLYELVDTVVDWIGSDNQVADPLSERWQRVVASINDEAERNYCVAAGRLGFDPYDMNTPDFSIYAAELPENSFDDLCDAVRFEELSEASAWVSRQQSLLEKAPAIDLSGFGALPPLDPARPAWQSGYRAAVGLKAQLGLDDNPLRATEQLLGKAPSGGDASAPNAIEGLLVRETGQVRSLVQARSSRQWRFRTCRAAYLGWGAHLEDYPLITTAATHRQQASRAFAAELLCPTEYLRHKVGGGALTPDQIDEIADTLDCQTAIVEHQARNHDIPTRGLY